MSDTTAIYVILLCLVTTHELGVARGLLQFKSRGEVWPQFASSLVVLAVVGWPVSWLAAWAMSHVRIV